MKKRILAFLLTLCMLVGAFPFFTIAGAAEEAIAPSPAPERTNFPYWEYYVQNGLTMLLDAYNTDNGTLSLGTGAGTWRSRVANKSGEYPVATLAQKAGATWWQPQDMGAYTGMGVGYHMTFSQFSAERTNNTSKLGSTVGLDLGIANLPEGDYTVETVLDPRGVVETDGTLGYVTENSTSVFTWYGWSLGALKGWSFGAGRFNTSGTFNTSESYNIRWTMATGAIDFGKYSWLQDRGVDAYGTHTQGTKYTPHVLVHTVTMDETATTVDETTTYTGLFASYQNGTQKVKHAYDNSGSAVKTYFRKADVTSLNYFHVAYGFPSTIYAVRVYDRVLAADEIARNRAVDLLAFYEIALDIPEVYRSLVMEDVIDLAKDAAFTPGDGYQGAKEALQEEVDALLQGYDFSDGDYLGMYEEEGLSILLSAFAPNPLVDLDAGVWYSANGNGKKVTIYESSNFPWSVGKVGGVNSGIGYTGSGVLGGGKDSGLRFDFADLPDGDYTLELLLKPSKLTVTGGTSGVPYAFALGYMKGYGWPKYTEGKTPYTNLDVTWYYGPTNHESSVFAPTIWCIDDHTFHNYNEKTLHYAITHDYTQDSNASVYSIFRDAAANASSSKTIPGDKRQSKDTLAANYQLFRVMEGFPSTIYGVRLYTKVLSQEEKAWNRAVDICAYYRLDVSEYLALSDLGKETLQPKLRDALSGFGFSEENYAKTKSLAQDVLDALVLSEKQYELYVKEGLVAFYQAYDERGGVDLAAGKWADMLGGPSATLVGGAFSSSNLTGWYQNAIGSAKRGIRYDQTGVGQKSGIELDYSLLPTGDYTVDMMVAPVGLTNSDGTPRYFSDAATYGESYAYGFRLGAFKGYVYPSLRSLTNYYYEGYTGPNSNTPKQPLRYASHQVMWYYASSEYNYSWKINDYCLYNASPRTDSNAVEAIGYTFTLDEQGTAGSLSGVYNVSSMGDNAGSYTAAAGTYVPKADAQDKYFSLFYSFPAAIYSVRVYDRVLSGAEVNRNHFADIVFYYDLDVTELLSLEGSEYLGALAALSTAFAQVKGQEGELYGVGHGQAKELYRSTLYAYLEEEDPIPFYQRLYSAAGLTVLLEGEAENVDLAGGKWYSSLGDGYAATLRQISGSGAWSVGDGAVSLRLNKAESLANATGGSHVWYPGASLELGAEALPETDYSIEAVVRPWGIMEDGVRTMKDGANSTWLNQVGFAIGPLKAMSFTTVSTSMSETYAARWYYVAGAFDHTKSNVQDYALLRAYSSLSNEAAYTSAKDPSAIPGIITYGIHHTVGNAKNPENAQRTARYEMYYDASDKPIAYRDVAKGSYVPLSAVTHNLGFRLFGNMPVDLYSLRVYDRTLTLGERQMNHLADLVKHFSLDIEEDFLKLSWQDRAAIAERVAEFGFDAKEEDILSAMTPYFYNSGLYVTEGLVGLYKAFRGDSSSIDVNSGLWMDCMEGEAAQFDAGEWIYQKQGGLTFIQHFDALGEETRLALPASLIQRENYTVEILADVVGVREDNGGKLGDTVYLNHFHDGVYRLGALVGGMNVTPVDANLSYASRWQLGSTVSQLSTPAFTAQVDGVRPLSIEKKTQNGTEIYLAGAEELLRVSADQAPKAEEFVLFEANPAVVYCVRVYDRSLTEAEKQQNHFADLALYYNFNILPVLSMEAAAQAEFFQKFVSIGFDYTEAQAQAIFAYHLGNTQKIASELLTYDGLAARLSGEYGGIRSLFTVDRRLVSFLEGQGVKVSFGAIMGVGDVAGQTVHTTATLAVEGAYATGYQAVGNNAAAVTIYATASGALAYAPKNTYVSYSAESATFAYTTLLDASTSNKAHYNVGLVYSGFVSLYDGEAETVYYAPGEGSTFGSPSAKYGDATSLCELSTYLVNEYTGTNDKMYAYWSNPRLNAVMAACGVAVTRTVIDEAALLVQRTQELEAVMEKHRTAELKVCGAAGALDGKTAYVWLQWQPQHKYAVGGTVVENVRAAYLYYPLTYDPSLYTEEELLLFRAVAEAQAAGTYKASNYTAEEQALIAEVALADGKVEPVVRTFCYLGIPDGAESAGADSYAGIVLTHGGGGHAYANYTMEGVNYGYVSVAMDTEGYAPPAPQNGAEYEISGSASEKDPLGHIGKDNWSHAKERLDKQWMYYAVSDVMFCNTLLRSLSYVDEDRVGMTGISWGGVITSCTIGFDSRLAFAVPVYCGYYINENEAGLSINDFAASLWQPTERLEQVEIPTLVLTSQKDQWASINTSIHFYKTLGENGYLTFVHGMGHSQGAGACPGEIYYFGRYITDGTPFPGVLYQTADGDGIKKEDGREYTLELSLPSTIKVPTGVGQGTTTGSVNFGAGSVTVYYTTEPLTYSNGQNQDQGNSWIGVSLTPYQEGGVWKVDVQVPEEAYLYYISFRIQSDELLQFNKTTSNAAHNGYKGYLYTSTEVVVLGNGGILGQ